MRLLIFVMCSTCYAQNFALVKDPDFNLTSDPATVEYAYTPADAVAYAVSDITTVPKEDQPFQRYIWIPDGDKGKASQVSFAVNTAASRASIIIKPKIVADGKLVRWDLRRLAPRSDQYAQLFVTWEKLAFEPYFHIVRNTNDAIPTNAVAIETLPEDPPGSARFRLDDQILFRASTGEWFTLVNGVWVLRTPIDKPQNVATFAAHVGLQQAVLLQGLTQSSAPIVRYDYFITKSLSTTNNGLYYEFIGIERNPSGKTSQEAFLESLGVTEEQIANLRADQRSAIFRSNVTGGPRRIDLFQGPGVKVSSGSGLITITHDIGEDSTGADQDPIRNLLDFKDKAREVITERPNGMHYFVLFNSDGDLQDSAPDDVVRDHTIPSPHPARVQPAIGCIRCHGPHSGWQPFGNDVQKMLNNSLTIFGDFSSKLPTSDTLERLAGLYTGDLSKVLRRARDDYSDAVYIATNGSSVAQVSDGVSQTYGYYNYTMVDPQIACTELGYRVPKKDAVRYINLILPPLPSSTNVTIEDPILGALKAGIPVNRFQWEQVYADAAFRAMQSQILREKIE